MKNQDNSTFRNQDQNQNQDHNQDHNQKLSRQEYNKRYYEQNRAKLLQKRKGEGTADINVLPLFAVAAKPAPTLQGSQRSQRSQKRTVFEKVVRAIELVALIALTAVMTFLLVKESSGFYLDANESPLSAYIKAGMIELTAILFSFSRSRSPVLQWGQRFVLVMLCGLSLFTMSQRVVRNASQDSARAQASMSIIRELETQRNQKEALREQYLKRGYLGTVRRYERGLEQVRDKLISAQQTMATLEAPHVIANSLAVMMIFRLALLIANLVCVHRIAEWFSSEMLQHQRK